MRLAHQVNWAIEQDTIDVTPAEIVEPDRKWSVVDSKGHFHAFSDADKEHPLPTLFRRQREIQHEEELGDGYIETWTSVEATWHCRICEEVVTPKWVVSTPTYRVTEPGRLSWRVEIRAIGSENARKLRDLDRQQVSVRILDGDSVYFGVGQLVCLGHTAENETIRWFGCVYGNGPLGSREEVK